MAAEHEYVRVWVSHAVMGIAATLSLILRFVARKKTRAKLGWDDWLAVVALVLMWGDFACTIMEYRPYLRRVPPNDLNVDDHSELKLLSFISIFFTGGCEVIARLSVVFLYYRLFSVKRWLGWCLKIIAALSIIWLLIIIFTITFQCTPIAAVVNAAIEGECLDAQFGFLLTEAINLVLDLALVLLPIKTIWSLQLPFRERMGIVIIFLTGSALMVTQILRMVFGYNPDSNADRSITSLSQLSIWTGLHLGFAIMCACLPVLRMYLPSENGFINTRFRLFYRSVSGWASRFSRNRSTNQTTDPSLPTFENWNADPERAHPSSDEVPLKAYNVVSLEVSGMRNNGRG